MIDNDPTNDLMGVGALKLIGYLPLVTLERAFATSVQNVKEELAHRGLGVLRFREDQCRIASGALYAFHFPGLMLLLRANLTTLKRCGWPIEPYDFVERVAQEEATDDELRALIGKAFADPRYSSH